MLRLVIILAVGLFAISLTLGLNQGLSQQQSLQKCLSTSEGNPQLYHCLENHFLTILKDRGPTETLRSLAEADQLSNRVLSLCHPLVHRIGRESFFLTGEAVKAYAAGNETCANGYYHGVLEGYLSKAPQLEEAVVSFCQSSSVTKITSYIHFQCVHGLGHGLMFKTGDDLSQSLKYCNLLATAYDRESCYGGVFMQNIVNNNPATTGHGPPVLKNDNLLFPCDDDSLVPEKYKSACYFLVSSRIVQKVYPDWKTVGQWCDRVEETYRWYCYQSMGRDIYGAVGENPYQSYAACQLSNPSYIGQCIKGVVEQYLDQDPYNPKAASFCNLVDASYRAACFRGIGEMFDSIYQDQSSRKSACEKITQTYLEECQLEKTN